MKKRKHSKKVKKRWKKILIISLISVVLLSLILFAAGLRIRFAISDALVIQLTPNEQSFTLPNSQNQTITFHTSIKDSIFCSASCSYSFYDRSGEKLIDKGSLILKNAGSFNRTYTITPYRKGSGQKIYNFEVQCSNINSIICSTKSPLRARSSFITLNYELTGEEERIKTELKPLITESFILINNASENIQKALIIINSTEGFVEYKTHYSDYNAILESLSNAVGKAKEISDLWSAERYISLDYMYRESLINLSNILYSGSASLLQNISESISRQNSIIESCNSLKDYFYEISVLNERYTYYSGLRENITSQLNETYNHIKLISTKLSSGSYESLSLFGEDLSSASALVSGFNTTLNNNYNSIMLKGRNLSLYEYSKKCYLGYCENITGNVCQDMQDILDEYKTALYDITGNMSVPETGYYIKTEDKIKVIASNESEEFNIKYCSNLTENLSYLPAQLPDIKKLGIIGLQNVSFEKPLNNELTENLPLCCVYGKCSPCCSEEECRSNPDLFPVILIHGHSLLRDSLPEPLLDSFNKIQYQLQDDGYINAGTILYDSDFSQYKENDWGLSGFPVAVKASYYYDYFYSLGNYVYITRSKDNLDTYAVRLNEIINLVKYRTGKPKVNIIAHSMGGLVARRYLQIFGDGSVDKIILIATPNKGIKGDVRKFCRVFGEQRECEDMYDDSIFIKKLNDPNYKPANVKIYTISGTGCKTAGEDGDGVVTLESSKLDYAASFVVNGTCAGSLQRDLHSDILDIDKYPKAYEYIQEILGFPSKE